MIYREESIIEEVSLAIGGPHATAQFSAEAVIYIVTGAIIKVIKEETRRVK
jgi:hypothetical protein